MMQVHQVLQLPGRVAPAGEPLRVGGPADDPAHVPDPVAEVVTMARDAASLFLSVQDENVAVNTACKIGRSGQPGGTSSDDEDFRRKRTYGVGHAGISSGP